jgi:hypothetical protein
MVRAARHPGDPAGAQDGTPPGPLAPAAILGRMTTEAADLILRGGAIHTVDDALPHATALAVRAGRIVTVGADRDVDGLIGPRTHLVELRGRTVLPGFQDAHLHPITSGSDKLRCDLFGVPGGAGGAVDAVRAYAVANPDVPWIVGSGWSMSDFPGGTPHRRDLDRAVGDRPVYLENRDGHTAWVSSRALELAGIDASSADPPGGRIERDPDGSPSGALHEAATKPVEDLLPATTDDERERGLLVGQAYAHSVGITAWQDANVRPGDEAAYRTIDGRGQLTGRVVGALRFEAGWDVDAVDVLIERRATGGTARFAPTSVKIMVDGVLEVFSGAMLTPYLGVDGRPTDRTGILFFEPDLLTRVVTRLDAEGFQCHFHVIGDRAARVALDAIEAALRANGPTDARHQLAHIQLIHPDDVPRFAALGAVANAQPLWACHDPQMDELTIPFLGPERSSWQYPFGSLLRAGARLAMGSDWGVSTADVLEEIQVAVERVHHLLAGRAAVFYPDERISLDRAVHAFTMGSAYANHLDDATGSLTVGKLADLVVLDRDLWDRGAGMIAEARVIGTFIDGRPVYETPALEG